MLDGEESTDKAFEKLDLCKNLKSLHISYAKQVTKTTLEKIAELNNLESLTLRHTNINDPGAFKNFFHQAYFPNMKILNLEKCDSITDEALFLLPFW